MSVSIIIFIIIFYLNFRFLIIFALANRHSNLNSFKQYLLILPLLSLYILGFLIMKWYLFLIVIFVPFFDPIQLLSPRLYFNKVKVFCFNLLEKHFYKLLSYYVLSTIGLWINYQNFIN